MAENTLDLLAEVVRTLAEAQVKTWLFGGWAEELSGLCLPRPHRDIDLLYPAQSFDRLDEFLRAQRGAKEVEAKRFSHKRAFEWAGVLVEVFLVRSDTDTLETDFLGRSRLSGRRTRSCTPRNCRRGNGRAPVRRRCGYTGRGTAKLSKPTEIIRCPWVEPCPKGHGCFMGTLSCNIMPGVEQTACSWRYKHSLRFLVSVL